MSAMPNLDAWLQERETAGSGCTKAQNIARVKALYAKLLAKGIRPIRGFDCSGFVFFVYNRCGLMSTRTNAASYYNKSTKIERAGLLPGDLVFRHDGVKISHMGIHLGDNQVVHAKGRDFGVVEEPISKYGWNRYGRWAGVNAASAVVPSSGTPYVLPLGTVYVRKGSGKTFKAIGIANKAMKLPYLGTDTSGEQWYMVTFQGQTGYISKNPKYTRLVE